MTGVTTLPSDGAARRSAPVDRVIPPIESSIEPGSTAGDFLERYYDCRYMLDVKEPGHDYRLLFHSNGLIVVTLAPSHPLMAPAVEVTSIDFQVTEHTNRLKNTVLGKGKRGAQVLTAGSPLFRAVVADGRTFVVPACVRGKLIQLNEKLLNDPSLLTRDADGGGGTFLAVVLPKLGSSGGQKVGTIDSAEYARGRMDVLGSRKRDPKLAQQVSSETPKPPVKPSVEDRMADQTPTDVKRSVDALLNDGSNSDDVGCQ